MIEDLIYKAVLETTDIIQYLTNYNHIPAVFYQTAPHDKDKLWDAEQYPRIDYNVDWQYNAERKTEGTMSMNVWCLNESVVPPEDIGVIITNELSEIFLTDETGTYSMLWNRTDSFEATGNEPQTVGVTMIFDIIALPVQEGTTTPDPITSVNRWAKRIIPEAKIIGLDEMPSIIRPNEGIPVMYFRINSNDNAGKNTYSVAWMNVSIIGHVMAATHAARLLLLKRLAEDLAINGEIIMNDNSPMLVQRAAYNTGANPLLSGQITVSGQYGILRKDTDYPTMDNINIARKGGE